MKTAERRWRLLEAAADFIWPPQSLLSDRRVDRPGTIEPELWTQLAFLAPPWCDCCGFPFETIEQETAKCGACLGAPPAYTRARAALAYGDHARKLVLDLKRAGRRDGLATFAAWMAQAGADVIARSDIIVPTPLHWTRLLERRFNQSAWLAQALAGKTGKPVALDALRRGKRRRSQGGLSAAQRRRNVQGVFSATLQWRSRLEGRSVLIVDDVLTTGATVEACARALARVKVSEVNVLTLARVVRPSDLTI